MTAIGNFMIMAAVASTAAINVLPGADSLRLPLDITPALSASFAELRPGHYHGGIDFKTAGREGLEVKAVADGYVSRVTSGPGGYGNVVYIDHPMAGLTTVYAHLSRFDPRLQSLLDRFGTSTDEGVTVELFPWELPVGRGETIALSGNTGHSFGPHLHFETRRFLTQTAVDPLLFYPGQVADTTPPSVRGVALFGADGDSSKMISVDISASNPSVKAWGLFYPAILTNDLMDGQRNRYGVKHIRLTVDGELFWAKDLDSYDMSLTSLIEQMVPMPEKMPSDGWWEWTAVAPDNPFQPFVYATTSPGGVLVIDSERPYRLEYRLSDACGNTRVFTFTVVGTRPAGP